MDFPTVVDVATKQIGDLGEALFFAKLSPPEPVVEMLRDHLATEAPEWVDPSAVSFTADDTTKLYVLDRDGEEMKWESDGTIKASHRLSWADQPDVAEQVREEYGSTWWDYSFPVEIKTGGAKLDYRTQREVMEYVSTREDTQPIYVQIGVDGLPETFTIERLQFIRPRIE